MCSTGNPFYYRVGPAEAYCDWCGEWKLAAIYELDGDGCRQVVSLCDSCHENFGVKEAVKQGLGYKIEDAKP